MFLSLDETKHRAAYEQSISGEAAQATSRFSM